MSFSDLNYKEKRWQVHGEILFSVSPSEQPNRNRFQVFPKWRMD